MIHERRAGGSTPDLIFLVREEGGFLHAKAIGHPIFTQGKNLEELALHIREAVECHFDEGRAPRRVGYLRADQVEELAVPA